MSVSEMNVGPNIVYNTVVLIRDGSGFWGMTGSDKK